VGRGNIYYLGGAELSTIHYPGVWGALHHTVSRGVGSEALHNEKVFFSFFVFIFLLFF
jgi:hypothetical protein